MINYVNQMPGRSQGTSQQPYFHHPKHLTVYQLMWLLPYELSTVYEIKIDNHRAHCVYLRYIFVLINLSWFIYMLSQYNSNNVIIVICETPWMFLPLDILLEYWIVHVTFRLLYVVFTFPTGIFCRGVPGFATDCPCHVWCRGLTTCLLYVGPLFWKSSFKG